MQCPGLLKEERSLRLPSTLPRTHVPQSFVSFLTSRGGPSTSFHFFPAPKPTLSQVWSFVVSGSRQLFSAGPFHLAFWLAFLFLVQLPVLGLMQKLMPDNEGLRRGKKTFRAYVGRWGGWESARNTKISYMDIIPPCGD